LSYDCLREAVQQSHTNLVSGEWNIDTVKHYLWVNGINKDSVQSIVE
jgi:hypothetical protein